MTKLSESERKHMMDQLKNKPCHLLMNMVIIHCMCVMANVNNVLLKRLHKTRRLTVNQLIE